MKRRARTGAKKAEQGYTLVEVMMAVAIMTVGSVGILSLHQATTNGNRSAREMATATDLTRVYLERVRADALMWNAAIRPTSADTDYLFHLPVSTATPGDWFNPVPDSGAEGFNYAGLDVRPDGSPVLIADADAAYYCTNLKVTWILGRDAVRVDARVWWHRTASDTDREEFDCDSDPTTEIDVELATVSPRIRAVTASTVVRWSRLN